jgi:GTP-binding protein YchF
VGKSTLFNAFVGSTVAAAENFPFCTIEPNVVKVGVPDERLDSLAEVCGSQKVVPGSLEIRDIAGLIKGASSGAGMGNEFLSQIRGVQIVLHVVRCFSNPDINHVDDPVNIDPVKEYESVLSELIIADLELASRRLPALTKKATTNDAVKKALPTYEAVFAALEDCKPASVALSGDGNSADLLGASDELLSQLITAKPTVVLANVAAEDAANGNAYTERLAAHISSSANRGDHGFIVVSAPLEAEVAQIDDNEFKQEYLESFGLHDGERALPRVLAECKQLLRLVSYLTVGEVEAKAWFVSRGCRANEAAGVIHSDFVRNFEQAEIWNVSDILKLKGKSAARRAGLVRQKGKEYEVQDGDVIEFRVRNSRS